MIQSATRYLVILVIFQALRKQTGAGRLLVTDFDNDGFRDIIITNGFPRDVTDHDFIAFRKVIRSIAPKEFTLDQIPQVKLHNYAFHNNGNLTFYR